MNRARSLTAAILLFSLFASCAPKTTPAPALAPTPSLVPTATSIPHAAEIRFALIGNVTPVNVWALFDAKGYSYNNYAVMSGYYPRLYQLSIPDRNFETMAASGMPSSFQQEGNFYTATVPLRSDLKWTDGTPFTADDVAFTVNTTVSFQLGFDWHDFYNPDFIDHADAVDLHTVKFYFKQQPNVGVWQYGALQGPIVQKAYWSPKVSASAELLPSNDLAPQIDLLTVQAADMQSKINTVSANIAILSPTSSGYIQGIADIKSLQANLNQTSTALAKAQAQYDSAMGAARQSLYALDNIDEPTLGDWMPAGQVNGEWINKVNPAHPFDTPKFDRAVYKTFANQTSAFSSLDGNEVDLILNPGGLSVDLLEKTDMPPMQSTYNLTSQVSFIVFNFANPALADNAFRIALACLINWHALPWNLPSMREDTFVPDGNQPWLNPMAANPCKEEVDEYDQKARAIEILKSAGYAWQKEPTTGGAGQGLLLPNDTVFPPITLLAADDGTNSVAEEIEKIANDFGIPLSGISESAQDLHYKVFSSHQYDMAMLGYNVSEYPGYLCDWFKDGNPFGYQSDRLRTACEALNSTSDLSAAQKDVYEIQSILAQDLPFIPLYSGITYDAYRNIKYPFDSVLDGLSGIYGAPSLAIPAP